MGQNSAVRKRSVDAQLSSKVQKAVFSLTLRFPPGFLCSPNVAGVTLSFEEVWSV